MRQEYGLGVKGGAVEAGCAAAAKEAEGADGIETRNRMFL